MDIQRVSEQRLFLKVEDKVQQMGIESEKSLQNSGQAGSSVFPYLPAWSSPADDFGSGVRNEHARLLWG